MQVNKNVLLKGRVGTDAAVLSFSFKAWWQPSFTVGASAGYDMQTRKPVFGFVLNCENYGNIRWCPRCCMSTQHQHLEAPPCSMNPEWHMPIESNCTCSLTPSWKDGRCRSCSFHMAYADL